MDELRKKPVDQRVRDKSDNLKGKFKERVGKLTGDTDMDAAEGQVDQGEDKIHDRMGKAGRAISDLADRAKDKLHRND